MTEDGVAPEGNEGKEGRTTVNGGQLPVDRNL